MARPKSNKTKLTLWVDKNILSLAKQNIPNLSAFFEIKVLEAIKLRNSLKVDSPGFEPGASALRRRRSTSELRALKGFYKIRLINFTMTFSTNAKSSRR